MLKGSGCPAESDRPKMATMRRLPAASVPVFPCCHCGDGNRRFDLIAGKIYCPECLELLALGEAGPLIEQVERRTCAACRHVGTVRFVTFPLNQARPLEIDLCAEHLRALAGRRLRPYAFELLGKRLGRLGLDVGQIFMLHGAFYDPHGRALQPVLPVEDRG